jgi:N-acetylneuraminic acid mutarotase
MLKFFMLIAVVILPSCHRSAIPNTLPEPITNNAVALVQVKQGVELYSFNGLRSGKTWQDISNQGYRLHRSQWTKLPIPEQALPVLASTAVSIGTEIYVIGGYTVNEKGQEKSVPYIFALDTVKQAWKVQTSMPIPVDDTLALVYANRYIYLISGWHDVDNVNTVQVYDTLADKWFNATDFPAPAVFGHAGGIVDNQLLVCDGVKVIQHEKSKDFKASAVCVKGLIDPDNPSDIDWSTIPHHSDRAYYRMAATGDKQNNRIVFAGGSDNPYNYNGMGYDGVPSQASNLVITYQFDNKQWKTYPKLVPNNMDHRALLTDGHWFYILGGMDSKQQVMDTLIKFRLPHE